MNGESELEQLRRFNNEKAEALERCHKQLEDLQKDRERLEWLEKTSNLISFQWMPSVNSTLRQAIDTAMAQKEEK